MMTSWLILTSVASVASVASAALASATSAGVNLVKLMAYGAGLFFSPLFSASFVSPLPLLSFLFLLVVAIH